MKKWAALISDMGIILSPVLPCRGRRTKIYRRMGTKTLTLSERTYVEVFILTLLTSGRLNDYLADIEEQAQKRFERIVEQMQTVTGITEHLKAE